MSDFKIGDVVFFKELGISEGVIAGFVSGQSFTTEPSEFLSVIAYDAVAGGRTVTQLTVHFSLIDKVENRPNSKAYMI